MVVGGGLWRMEVLSIHHFEHQKHISQIAIKIVYIPKGDSSILIQRLNFYGWNSMCGGCGGCGGYLETLSSTQHPT